MPDIQMEFDPQASIFRISVDGTMDAEVIEAAIKQLRSQPDYYAGVGTLWDLTNTVLAKLSMEEISALEEKLGEELIERRDSPIAVCVKDKFQYGVARQFYSLIQMERLAVFYRLDDCVNWLKSEAQVDLDQASQA